MPDHTITRFLRAYEVGDDAAFDRIFEYYFDQLSRFARQQLWSTPRRTADEEDIALSALNHLAVAVRKNRYPDLKDRSELWKLLTVITIHKASDYRKWSNARKRRPGDGARLHTPENAPAEMLQNVASRQDAPETIVDFRDELEQLLAKLDSDLLREIAILRMGGETVESISNRTGIAVRSYAELIDEVQSATSLGVETLIRSEDDSEGETAIWPLPEEPDEAEKLADNAVDTESSNGQHFINEYELLDELGRGGMGIVYRARHRKLDRVVALKTIRSGRLADREEVERFHIEARAAAQLDHPNIVQIYEVGEQGDLHYFTMRMVEGDSLADRLKDNPLEPREAASIIRSIANGIDYAHERGIVHRDLKPANILLERNGEPQITDFGLAKNLSGDSGMTMTGQVMGTPGFMPPEQARGAVAEIGPQSDVYSLGAILYAALSGRAPFQAATPLDVLKQVVEREPVAVRQLNPLIDKDLDTICHKCLQKEPAKRYESAGVLADDLERYLNHEPISARPISVPARMVRWCRRNPLPAAFIGSLCIGLLAVSYLAKQMRDGRELAETQTREITRQKSELSERQEELDRKNAELTSEQAKLKTALAERDREERLRQIREAGNELNKGTVECEQNRIGSGLLHFVRGLELLPAGEEELEFTIRSNFDLWRKRLNVLKWQQPVGSMLLPFARSWRTNQDGSKIVTAQNKSVSSSLVKVRDTYTGETIGKPKSLDSAVVDAGFAPGGKELISINHGSPRRLVRGRFIPATNGRIHHWNLLTGKPVRKPFPLPGRLENAALSPDCRFAFLQFRGAPKNELGQVWSLQPFRQRHTLTAMKDVTSRKVRFSADGNYLGIQFVTEPPRRPGFGYTRRNWHLETGKITNDTTVAERVWTTSEIAGAPRQAPQLDRIREVLKTVMATASGGGPRILAVGPNGGRVAVPKFGLQLDSRVAIWNVQLRTPLGQPLPGKNRIVFHPYRDLCLIPFDQRMFGWYMAGSVPDELMQMKEGDTPPTAARMKLWAETATGLALATTGEPYVLEFADWQKRAQELGRNHD
eukprot:g21988.t1